MDIPEVLLISGAIAAIGSGLDHLLLERQRSKLYELVFGWWERIEMLKMRRLDREMAQLFLRAEHKIFGKKRYNFRWIFTALTISFMLTTLALVFGEYMFFSIANTSPPWNGHGKCPLIQAILYIPEHEPKYLYPINLFFDILTLTVTVYLISRLANSKSKLDRIWIYPLDITAAFMFAWLCYFVAAIMEGVALPGGVDPIELKINLASFKMFFSEYSRMGNAIYYYYFDTVKVSSEDLNVLATFLFSNTTLLPTIAYIVILFLLSLSRFIFVSIRRIVLQVLERSLETNKSIFFYTGCLLGLINIIFKLIFALIY
ncbi:MAG: hypothetical protein JXC36_04540 [Candidatus Atribacteria bacterium]|nr:hypothetical protein [Candidatus Atribacteria bacterium]